MSAPFSLRVLRQSTMFILVLLRFGKNVVCCLYICLLYSRLQKYRVHHKNQEH
jgi:hypothetical protein